MLKIILLVIVSILALIWILGMIWGYVYQFKQGNWFFHDILGWHMPDKKASFDGCSIHSHCRYCEKEIMQDSQGNWFEV